MCYNCNEKHSFFQFCTQFLGSFVLNLVVHSSLRLKKSQKSKWLSVSLCVCATSTAARRFGIPIAAAPVVPTSTATTSWSSKARFPLLSPCCML